MEAQMDLPSSETRFLVSLEGNICAGKSELLSWIGLHGENIILKEPINEWRDFRGYNLLDLKYLDKNNRKGYDMSFQILANTTRFSQLLDTHKTKNVILQERSLAAGIYVFAQRSRKEGSLTNLNYELLEKWLNVISSSFLSDIVNPDLIIYLDVPAEKCFERLKERNRVEERNLELRDLQDIERFYEQWLDSKHCWCPVLRIENDEKINSTTEVISAIKAKILMERYLKTSRNKAIEQLNQELENELEEGEITAP